MFHATQFFDTKKKEVVMNNDTETTDDVHDHLDVTEL